MGRVHGLLAGVLGACLIGVVAAGAAARATEAVSLALALTALAVGGLLARRVQRRADDYEDRARFRPATVELGRVVVDDDAEPWLLAAALVAPGRVLVRARPPTTTHYRTTRVLAASEIVRVDPATVQELAALRVADARRIAFALAVVCATVAAVEAAGSFVHDSHILDGAHRRSASASAAAQDPLLGERLAEEREEG